MITVYQKYLASQGCIYMTDCFKSHTCDLSILTVESVEVDGFSFFWMHHCKLCKRGTLGVVWSGAEFKNLARKVMVLHVIVLKCK